MSFLNLNLEKAKKNWLNFSTLFLSEGTFYYVEKYLISHQLNIKNIFVLLQ